MLTEVSIELEDATAAPLAGTNCALEGFKDLLVGALCFGGGRRRVWPGAPGIAAFLLG